MKKFIRLSIMTNIGLLLVIFLSGCGGDNGPVITGEKNITLEAGSVVEDWSVYIDAIDGTETVIVDSSMIDTEEVDMTELGEFEVTYRVPDSNGDTTKFVLTVTIVDTTAPNIFLVGSIVLNLTVGEEYIEPGIYIFDNYDTELTYEVVGNVDTNTIGEYFLNYTATDSNNNTSILITRMIIVSNHPQMVSDKDDIYFSMDDFEVTKEDIYSSMISSTGLNILLNYVDTLLLSDYIDAVTPEEVQEERLRLTFFTTNLEDINNLDPSVYQDRVDFFNYTLIEMGINPTNETDVDNYLKLLIAKRVAFVDYYMNEEVDESYYASSSQIEFYYEDQVKGDVCAIEIRFESKVEANLVFDLFNLVPDFESGIGEYYGVDPIDTVASDQFILDENTNLLDDEEVFSKFVLLYNYMNPWETQIPEDITQADYCNTFTDIAIYNFDDLMDNYGEFQTYYQYVSYFFDHLDTIDNRYFTSPKEFDDKETLVFKISQEEVPAFETLTELEKDEYEEEYIMENLISNIIQIDFFLVNLREKFEFNIVEPNLGILYEFQTTMLMDIYLDPTIIATFGETTITADMFYDYAEKVEGASSVIDLKSKYNLLNNGYYVELYGDDFDILTNTSYKMISNRDELQVIKEYFLLNYYVSYGFDSNEYSWDEFLFLAFGAQNETEALMNLFIYQTLINPEVMNDFDFLIAQEFVQYQYDNYFELEVEHLLLFIDFNNDFVPDNYLDYIASLDPVELIEFEGLIVSFESLVRTKFASGMTFEEIVIEYNETLINDAYSDYAIYRQYGFKLLSEDLSSYGNTLNSINTLSFDSTFRDSLKRIYDAYVVLQNGVETDIPSYLDTETTSTVFGLHIILSSKDENFDQPTAYYDDSIEPGEYTEGSGNLGVIPTQEQITLYKKILVDQSNGILSGVSIPPSVFEAIQYYYEPLFGNITYSNSFLIEAAKDIIDSSSEFSINNTENLEKINNFYEALLDRINDYE